jgi:hypothetical protein
VFAPYTDIPANLLFFERGGPTDTIWYYELPLPEGRKKCSKAGPLQFEEFAPALMAIEVAVPPLVEQQSFDRLQTDVAARKAKHTAIRQANAALIPATLERIFSSQAPAHA